MRVLLKCRRLGASWDAESPGRDGSTASGLRAQGRLTDRQQGHLPQAPPKQHFPQLESDRVVPPPAHIPPGSSTDCSFRSPDILQSGTFLENQH